MGKQNTAKCQNLVALTNRAKMATDTAHLERLRIKARNEMGEKDELIPDQIAQVRAILEADDTVMVPSDRFDPFLLKCLRARKYNIERAAKTYKKLCIVRRTVPEMCDKFIPTLHTSMFDQKFTAVLKSRDPLGRPIIYIRPGKWDPHAYTLDHALACLFLVLDEVAESIDTQYNGIVIAVDFKGFSLAHARQASPSRIQGIVSIIQDAYPANFKELHFLNHPSIFNMLFAFAKPFLKDKIRKRIYFHGYDKGTFLKAISPTILPISVGGQLEEDAYADKEIIANLLGKDEYYKDMLLNFRCTC